jgi:O-6-methylguanine DNA methyltransferase
MTTFKQKVHNAVKQIPKGKVMTYAAVARKIGNPQAAREVPCYRVVKSDRSAEGYNRGAEQKICILKKEGVQFDDTKVLNRFFI